MDLPCFYGILTLTNLAYRASMGSCCFERKNSRKKENESKWRDRLKLHNGLLAKKKKR